MITSPAPQISALSTALTDLTARVTTLAHELDRDDTQLVAGDLFEVERLLRTATRRLERARSNASA